MKKKGGTNDSGNQSFILILINDYYFTSYVQVTLPVYFLMKKEGYNNLKTFPPVFFEVVLFVH